MRIKKATAIMIVDRIEPELSFWEGKLAYKKVVEVPHEGEPGFVILARDDHEVMLQTRRSIAADLPQLADLTRQNAVIQFIEVDSVDAVVKRLEREKILVPPRTTFYGMKEVFIQDPAGYVIAFAEKLK